MKVLIVILIFALGFIFGFGWCAVLTANKVDELNEEIARLRKRGENEI